MKLLFGKIMNYNFIVIISLIICAIISFVASYLSLLMLSETSALFKVSQLIIAIISMTTFYAPIKHFLLKYMEIKEDKSENEND